MSLPLPATIEVKSELCISCIGDKVVVQGLNMRKKHVKTVQDKS